MENLTTDDIINLVVRDNDDVEEAYWVYLWLAIRNGLEHIPKSRFVERVNELMGFTTYKTCRLKGTWSSTFRSRGGA